MLADAGFRDIRIDREKREGVLSVFTIIGIQLKQGSDLCHRLTSGFPKQTAYRYVRK